MVEEIVFKKAHNPLGPGGKEKWNKVQGWPKYFVSNIGRVKSYKQDPLCGRYLKQKRTMFGYVAVSLFSQSRKSTLRFVHRIVAEAFIERDKNRDFVNHIDCNKLNNCITNLEWVTAKENAEHAKIHGKYLPTTGKNHWTHREKHRRKLGELNGRAILTEPQVREIKFGKKKDPGVLAKKYGVTRVAIVSILKNKNWRHVNEQ